MQIEIPTSGGLNFDVEDTDAPKKWYSDWHDMTAEAKYDTIKAVLTNIQKIESYTDENTPFDDFDSQCHNEYIGSKGTLNNLQEEDIIFMINVSEHVNRPHDMLMFLGEFFKEHIRRCEKIDQTIQKDDKGPRELDRYFITFDIINQLGTACKKFIEKPRQELRISIALSRKPVFSLDPDPDEIIIDPKKLVTPELEALKKNIVDQQLFIIDQCRKVYRFIDYLHDRRKEVKLKNVNYQPQKNILNALLYKMKADYLRYIFECLNGDDGLLKNDQIFTDDDGVVLTRQKERFDDDTEQRFKNEINRFEKQITCLFCNRLGEREEVNLDAEGNQIVGYANKTVEEFFKQEKTLIDYFKHEVYHEYERAKLEIFDKEFNQQQQKQIAGINEAPFTPFHPVYLSTLLNQQVFRREVMAYEQKEKEYKLEIRNAQKKRGCEEEEHVHQEEDESEVEDVVDIKRETSKLNREIIEYVQLALNAIDANGSIETLLGDEKKLAYNLLELIEKCIDQWDEA